MAKLQKDEIEEGDQGGIPISACSQLVHSPG